MAENLSTQIANDLLDLTSQLPRVQSAMTIEVRKQLLAFQNQVIQSVKDADVLGVTAKRFQQKRALALIKSVKELTRETYRDISKQTEAQLIDLAGASTETFGNAVNDAAQGAILTNTLSSPQLKQLVKQSVIDGATSSQWWSKQAGTVQFKFENVVQDSVLNGRGTDDIVRRIRGTKAMGFRDGFMNTAYNDARSLVHTSVQNVANDARLETMLENDDIIGGIEWLSTLDGHTTQICKSLDGLVWDLEKKPVGHKQEWVGATAHWQCRSTQVPVLKGFSDLPKSKQATSKGVRASLDGKPVSGAENYDSWLKKKDKKNSLFVKNTLGAEKYKIWKKKGLSMLDMVDQHNNPLTVEQLRAKFDVKIKPVAKPPVKIKTPKKPRSKPKSTKHETGTVEIFSKKEATKRLQSTVQVAAKDVRYLVDEQVGTITKFGNHSRQLATFGTVDIAALSNSTASALLKVVDEANAIVGKIGVQPIRGINTKSGGRSLASMGDGILHVQPKYFNQNGALLDKSKAAESLEAMIKKKDIAKAKYEKLNIEYETKFNSYGREERRVFAKEFNKTISSFNRYNMKVGQLKFDLGTGSTKHSWKIGDPLSGRPHNAFEFYESGLDEIRSTVFHEFGHQVHQQYGVKSISQYRSPPVEAVIAKIIRKDKPKTSTKYMDKPNGGKEWFAESFSLYHMGRHDLLDPVFIRLMDSLEAGTFEDFAKGYL